MKDEELDYDFSEHSDFMGEPPVKLSRKAIVIKTLKRAGILLVSFPYNAELPLLLAMIGRLKDSSGDNTNALAAASIAIPFYDIPINLSTGAVGFAVMFVGSHLYRQLQNEKNWDNQENLKEEIASLIKNGLYIAMPVAVCFMPVMYYSKDILTTVFRQDSAVAEVAQQFLRPAAILLPLYALRFIQEQIFFIHERQKEIAIISIVSFAIGIFLSYSLGFGHFNFPDQAMRGIFLGLFAENILGTLGVAACFFPKIFRGYSFLRSVLRCTSVDWDQLRDLCKHALALGLTYVSELLTVFVKNILASYLGDTELAAQNFSGQVTFFMLFLTYPVAQAVALNVAGADFVNRNRMAYYGLLTAVLAGTLPCIPVSIFPKILTEWMGANADTGVMEAAQLLIPLSAITAISYTAGLTMLQSLRTTSNHIRSTVVFNVWQWLGVAASWALAFHGKMGVTGIGLGSMIGTILASGHLALHWRQAFKSNEAKAATEPLLAPHSLQHSINAEEEPQRVSSAWCGCFSRLARRWRQWYYGPEISTDFINESTIRSLN
jgi:multidrug resistance protein, MATE family